MALGATIDFEAGNMKRTPKWISQTGFEWLFKLLYEPKRLWRRYIIEHITFLLLILKQKLNLYLKGYYLEKNPKDSRNF